MSSSVGMPIGRVFPALPGFGICTRRTAGARYCPDLNRSSKLVRFASKAVSYCAAVTPSTPAAPSLRVRRYASRSHVSSMWCANVVSSSFGSIRASSASFSCRVEMTSRPDVLAICPSRSPMPGPPLPSAGFLGAGSPTSPVLSADSDPSPPIPPCFVSFARWYHALPRSLPGLRPIPGAWAVLVAAPGPLCVGGDGEVSQVPGRPLPACPALRPRRSPASGPCDADDGAFRKLNDVGSASNHFRGSITRPTGSLCTLRSRGRPRTTQHSVPAGGQPWPVRVCTCWVA